VTGGEPTIITVITSQCRFCEESVAGWTRLAQKLSPEGVRLVGLSLDTKEATMSMVEDWQVVWPVLRRDSDANILDAFAPSTPVTALLAPSGTIDRVWWGAVSVERADAMVAPLRELAGAMIQEARANR
jgi:hypothetical protein